jgi:hypothetical protein
MSAFDEIVAGSTNMSAKADHVVSAAAAKVETAAAAEAPKAAGWLKRIAGGIWKVVKAIFKRLPGAAKVASVAGLTLNFIPGVGWIKMAWDFVKSPAFKLLLAVGLAIGCAGWASVKTHQYDTATEQLAIEKANAKAAEDNRLAAEAIAQKDEKALADFKAQSAADAAKAKDISHAAAKLPHAADHVFPDALASQLQRYINAH